MTAKLRIASDFTLPLDMVTTSSATFGIRGSGKTNTNVVIAEEMLERRLQLVIVDPTDGWWGLKSSKDGQHAGYPIVVLGGRHQDLPLGAGDGPTIADFVVDEGASVILSLRHFESDGERRRFITDFARRLYFRKGRSDTPTPVMVIIDEASLVVPQRVMGEDARMVGAIQQLIRQGRSSGIGVSLIDQRPATVNKDVLAMVELLVVHRVLSPQDRKALLAWVEQHDTKGVASQFLDQLASLEQGHAWFWSPGWLDVFRKVKVRERRTFDSSYTPKAGERVVAPTTVAELDLVALQAKLGATIEKARAADPAELQKRIRILETENKKLLGGKAPAVDPTALQAKIDNAVEHALHDERKRQNRLRQVLKQAAAKAQQDLAAIGTLALRLPDQVSETAKAFAAVIAGVDDDWMPAISPASAPQVARAGAEARPRLDHGARAAVRDVAASNGGIGRTPQRMLNALKFLESVDVSPATRKQVAGYVGVVSDSGSFRNYLSELRAPGYIEDRSDGAIALTAAGRLLAADEGLPTSLAELHETYLRKLGATPAKMLRILIDAHPDAMQRSALGAMLSIDHTSGSFRNYLSEIRSPGLLEDVTKTEVRASDLLFPPGLS